MADGWRAALDCFAAEGRLAVTARGLVIVPSGAMFGRDEGRKEGVDADLRRHDEVRRGGRETVTCVPR